MTAVVPPIQLRCFRRIQAYPITKTNVPSPLGTILLILKRKRPFLYGKMAIFSTLRCIFLRPLID